MSEVFYNADMENELSPTEQIVDDILNMSRDDSFFAHDLIDAMSQGENTFWQVRASLECRADSDTFKRFCEAFDGYFVALDETSTKK
ncbi:MAG: hypothetical protein ABSG01_10025 [Anaerolineales bacterium]|jgi:hypothetical protein